MIRCNSEADSIVWMEEGDSTRVGFDSRTPENEICFWVFLRIQPDVWPDSTPRALTCARRFICKLVQSVRLMDINLPKNLPTSAYRGRFWLGLGSLFAGLLCWQISVSLSGLPAFILPAPGDVWARFVSAVLDGSLLINSSVTLIEVLLGLLSGVTIATVMGYLLAKSRKLERVLSPYLVASQAVPLVAIAPLLIIWFGPGMFSKVLICALIVLFPVLVNTVVGVRAVPHALYDLMNSLHATRRQILLKLEIPAALPIFLGGLRIGATLSVIGAVVGELVGADSGLGFLINIGRGQYDTALVFVAVFTLILLALLLYGIVAFIESRALRWQEWHKK
jgi:NitT/TauT family transport system permease protein